MFFIQTQEPGLEGAAFPGVCDKPSVMLTRHLCAPLPDSGKKWK